MQAETRAETGYDVLARICEETREEVERRKKTLKLDLLRARIAAQERPRGFGLVLKHAVGDGRFALIAEIKKASPSGGLIRADFDAATLARAYRDGGATCSPSSRTSRISRAGPKISLLRERPWTCR